MTQDINRREFVARGAAASAALAATSAVSAGALAEDGKDAPKPRIVRLDLLTSREVGEWLKTNDVIFVPHGPISGHGPWTTLGVHTHGAEAVATLLARKCNGLVYPPIYTCFAGATHLYPGTVPFSYEFHIQILKAVGVDTRTLKTVNVLDDDAIRQGIKEYSNWPTIPQLYVKGEFVGGCDIVREMYEAGELETMLEEKGVLDKAEA